MRFKDLILAPEKANSGQRTLKEQIPTNNPDDAPMAERITEVYWHRVRDTGLGEAQDRAMRSELRDRDYLHAEE